MEQQTATAEVLQVINSSPGDLGPVFDAMLEKAHAAVRGGLWRICEPMTGAFPPSRSTEYAGRFAESARQVFDVRRDPATGGAHCWRRARRAHCRPCGGCTARRSVQCDAVELGGIARCWSCRCAKTATLLGMITLIAQEVRPFTDKQIALLQNFAAQAVIAMENARLITETREALEQQTATAEVLQVINSSPGDLAPVFDVMLEKATHLCEARIRLLCDLRRRAASVRSRFAGARSVCRVPASTAVLGRAWSQPDRAGEPLVAHRPIPRGRAYGGTPEHRAAGRSRRRAHLVVALRKDAALARRISVYRQEVRPFTDKQIALLQNFAAQAVIAMENARLLTETREALEQQTATAEVLQVINSSPGDLAPVFDAMLEKAMRLCERRFRRLATFDGERFQPAARARLPADCRQVRRSRPA